MRVAGNMTTFRSMRGRAKGPCDSCSWCCSLMWRRQQSPTDLCLGLPLCTSTFHTPPRTLIVASSRSTN